MNADAMSAALSAEGRIIGIEAKGNVTGASDNADEKEEMASNEAVAEFWPATGRAKDLTLKGSAKVHTTNKKTGEVRDIQSEAVHVNFAGATMQEKARCYRRKRWHPVRWSGRTAPRNQRARASRRNCRRTGFIWILRTRESKAVASDG